VKKLEKKRKYIPIRLSRPESTVVAEVEENQAMPQIANRQSLIDYQLLSAQIQDAFNRIQTLRPRIGFQILQNRIQMLNAIFPASKEQKKAEIQKCWRCEREVPKEAVYCSFCGVSLKSETIYGRAGSKHLSIEGG